MESSSLSVRMDKTSSVQSQRLMNETFEEMKSSGLINFIRNDSLKLMLNAYYAQTEHLNQDYEIKLSVA